MFVKKGGVPDRVESFGEVNSSKERPRAGIEFVTSNRNGLRKIKNLNKSKPSRAEFGLAGRVNKVRLHKEEQTR